MEEVNISNYKIYYLLVVLVLFFVIVISSPPIWVGSDINYTHVEEDVYYHNLTTNITGFTSEIVFAISTTEGYKVNWNNGTATYNYTGIDSLPWISLISDGNLTFSSSYNNQTGFFIIPIQAKNSTNDEGSITNFEFIINATDDAPNWTFVYDNYTYPTSEPPIIYFINLSDEEHHYPLNFSINFTNCTHASWIDKEDGENCSLFNIINLTNDSAYLNYTPIQADIGVYNATFIISEAAHSCPHEYCEESTYSIIKTLEKNITITVLAQLDVNISDCINREFIEGEAENCTIEIQTRGETDTINLSSIASFLNYGASPSNTSWFYPLTQASSSDNSLIFNISVNATHSQVGNWKINFTTLDLSTNEFNWSNFNIFVNWTGNNAPILFDFEEEYNTSINKDLIITFNVTDDDFLIQDKAFYNETSNINVTIINSTGQEVSGFHSITKGLPTNSIIPINITFSPDDEDTGEYIITLNATDNNSSMVYDIFNLTVIDNNYPYWNQTNYLFNFTVNSTVLTTKMNFTNLNLSRIYANDSNILDTLSFSISGNYPPSVSLASNGIFNFFPWKRDVGLWEFNITVSDDLGLENTSIWVFNVSNINSLPDLDNVTFASNGSLNNFNLSVNQNNAYYISFFVYDNDLWINDTQILDNGYYNESLTLETNITNTSAVNTLIDLDFSVETITNNYTKFKAVFSPIYNNTGNYSISLNVSDESSENDSLTFNLEIIAINDAPDLSDIPNMETSIMEESFLYDANATDEEDDMNEIPLVYTIERINSFAPNLTINSSNGIIEFNFSNNESYGGVWEYRVNVSDSESDMTSDYFNLTVYGFPNITIPDSLHVFNLTENSTNRLNFSIDYMVNFTNLFYSIYLDNITCYWINESENNKSCNYSNLSIISEGSFNWSYLTNLTYNLSLGYYDETYGEHKNLSLFIYNEDYPLLNDSIYYKLNISHNNSNLTFNENIPDISTYNGVYYYLDLSDYFYDIDVFDEFYEENVNFSLNQSSSSQLNILSSSSITNWNLSLYSGVSGTANISVTGFEFNDSDFLLNNLSSNWFIITFSAPPTQIVNNPSTGGSSSTRTEKVVEHYSLKIIAPEDIIISPEQYIEINFSVVNTGEFDLVGIDLSSIIKASGSYNGGISMTLSEDHINVLHAGEKKDFKLRAYVNTETYGEYKVTLFANVTSPKISDWADFFIKIQSLDESQLSELLIFTEKMISENPECMELAEVYNDANLAYEQGNWSYAKSLAEQAIKACEDSISANEQIRFFDNQIGLNLLYSLVITLFLFLAGFIYYFYRRIKFKKLIDKDYI